MKRERAVHDYYVYVYIDPRNHEEFYYGKGQGSRKDAHLHDPSKSSKTKRIKEIKNEGLEPIVRVIARGLSESEALLVEKTLLWKLGKWTTNIASGHFARKFRPHNALHKKLVGFDFQLGLYYYNVGEGKHRNWDDYRKFSFISAGQGERWGRAMRGFNVGDDFVAYLSRFGFVGVGRIISEAKMIRDVHVNGKPLLSLPLVCRKMSQSCGSIRKSEYVCLVKWYKSVPRSKARSVHHKGLFTPQKVRATLQDPKTIKFLESKFNVKLRKNVGQGG
jgi:hypothetical protein